MAVHTSPTKSTDLSAQIDGTPAQSNSEGFPKTYPAPPQLSTPTDLTAKQAEAVTNALNPIIADAFALYTKTKNFHWHLSGPRFRDLHLLFDKQATQIFESIDPMVERLRKIGGTSVRSITHISKLQTIQDDNDEFVTPQDMVLRLAQDNRHVAQQLRAASDTAEENKDLATANLLETFLDDAERRTWFLFEILQEDNAVTTGK